jgi:iron complex transport system substrate-binding protein
VTRGQGVISFAASALLALTGCRSDAAQQQTGKVRIMSMNPCIDAILVRVTEPGEIVSISHYSHDPAATSIPLALAKRFPTNDGTAEEVVAAQPTVVLLGLHGDPATERAIRAAGVKAMAVGVPSTISESLDQIRAVARIAGHPARGEALVGRIEEALNRAKAEPGTRPIDALIRQGQGLVPGKGTLADELLTRTGFRNKSADYGLAMWDVLPLEPLMARPPRLLLMDMSVARTRRAALSSVRQMRVADFPERLLRCAGPNLIDAAARLAQIRREVRS